MKLINEKRNVTISSLVIRNDKYKEKVKEVNTLLKEVCLRKNFYFLDHSTNIHIKHINKSRVHLNNFGKNILVKNVSSHLCNIFSN